MKLNFTTFFFIVGVLTLGVLQKDHTKYTELEFYKLYNSEDPKNPSKYLEIQVAKNSFPTKLTRLMRREYKSLITKYLDGSIHGQKIHKDIEKEALFQITKMVNFYFLETYPNKGLFFLSDLYTDIFKGQIYQWIDKHHNEFDNVIEPDL